MRLKFTIKILCTLAILPALILGISIWGKTQLEKSSNEIDEHVARIESYIKEEHWDELNTELEAMQADWNTKKSIWAMLIDHEEIDNIDNALVKMSKYIENREITDALAEAAALRQFIRHIPQKEVLNLENVF